jgi:protein O-mannosyl-transferase
VQHVRRQRLVLAALLAGLVVASHANTWHVPFLLDDLSAVTGNASIRALGDWWRIASSATGTTAGRPLLNLSFALNYAWTKDAPWSYHVVNVAIHCAAALVLFRLVERVVGMSPGAERFRTRPTIFAAVIAGWWALHPLQTAAITYISQRAESLMGLFYVCTVYAFVRAESTRASVRWQAISVLSGWAAMATKEVAVTAPVLVLLLDRAFFRSSFREILRERGRYYAALAASWLMVGFLLRPQAHAVGWGQGVEAWSYLATQSQVIMRYVALAIWPTPLVFDYGPDILLRDLLECWPQSMMVITALGAALWLWRKSPRAALPIATFFLLLAPTSSFVPIAGQPMAESRMYLPLIPLITGLVCVLHRLLGHRPGWPCLAIGSSLAVLSFLRNADYASERTILEDSLRKHPANSRAQNDLANVAAKEGRSREAIWRYAYALRLRPHYVDAHYNLGALYTELPGHDALALPHYEAALRLAPGRADVHNNIGNALMKVPNRFDEALAHYREALRLDPNYAIAHNNLAVALAKMPGSLPEALAHYETALGIEPDYADAHVNLANAILPLPGRLTDAIRHLKRAAELRPRHAATHNNLAVAYARNGQLGAAIRHLETALRLEPEYAAARENLREFRALQPK